MSALPPNATTIATCRSRYASLMTKVHRSRALQQRPMSLNGVGVILTAHVFSLRVSDVTVNVLTAEITISMVTVRTNNRTWFDVFTDDWL